MAETNLRTGIEIGNIGSSWAAWIPYASGVPDVTNAVILPYVQDVTLADTTTQETFTDAGGGTVKYGGSTEGDVTINVGGIGATIKSFPLTYAGQEGTLLFNTKDMPSSPSTGDTMQTLFVWNAKVVEDLEVNTPGVVTPYKFTIGTNSLTAAVDVSGLTWQYTLASLTPTVDARAEYVTTTAS